MRWKVAATIALFLAAAALRLLGGLNDFWLDEIWSLTLAADAATAWDVVTGLHHGNNHYLNTLAMQYLGAQPHWFAYRVPALIAGSLAPWIAWWIGKRRGHAVAVASAVAVGFSYFLIHYSSEARGYGTLMLFVLLAWDALDHGLERPRATMTVTFGVFCVAGFLSQPLFAHAYFAFGCWSVFRSRSFRRLAVLHAAPLACFALLYYFDLRHIPFGEPPRWPVWQVAGEAAAYAVGGPVSGIFGALAAIAALAAAAAGVWILRRERTGESVLYGAAIFVAPALHLVMTGSQVLYPRYFLVPAIFLVMLLARLVALGIESGGARRRAAVAVTTLFLLGNGIHFAGLLKHGRGDYLNAVIYMSDETEGDSISVGSDHDFRNKMLLGYYAGFLPAGKKLVYHGRGEWPEAGPEWIVTHSQDKAFAPAALISDERGHRYGFVELFPYSALSGWHWALYRRK